MTNVLKVKRYRGLAILRFQWVNFSYPSLQIALTAPQSNPIANPKQPDRPTPAIAKLRRDDRWESGFRDAIAPQLAQRILR
ncbi:MAG: hypothetical protein HC852_05395 [Acaryochloridaceae cyanobacterium RU_4_10]|nr:hypothetical protein [Acaryochloridaceae cyanobacterium RU_4_10]